MIIEVDSYKTKIKGYDPNNSENVHSESGKLADIEFKAALKSKKYKRIIFMAGGTASGKTEYAYSYLNNRDQLVYDGTLKNLGGFNTKLQKIQRYDKNSSKIKVVLVIPKNWIKAFEAFLMRDRKMSPYVFFETQIKSKITVANILLNTNHKVEIYVSDMPSSTGKLTYKRLKFFRDRKNTANLLNNLASKLKDIAYKNGFEIKL